MEYKGFETFVSVIFFLFLFGIPAIVIFGFAVAAYNIVVGLNDLLSKD